MTIDQAREERQAGNADAAVRILEQLLMFAPGDALVHYELAVTHGMDGSEDPALYHYRSALEAGLPAREEGAAALAVAGTLRSQGRFLEAARFLREMATRRPDDDGLRAFLALTLHKLGMHAEAISILVKLLVAGSGAESIRAIAPVLSFYAESLDQRTGTS